MYSAILVSGIVPSHRLYLKPSTTSDKCCYSPLLVGESDDPACSPPASSFITSAGSTRKSSGDNMMHMWVQLKRWRVSCVWMLQRGHSGDGCDLPSTLCRYDLRKGYLFVYLARCVETIDVCTWHMFVFMSVVVTVLGSVRMFVV